MWYQDWSGGFPAGPARRLARLGIVPMITWEPWSPPKVAGRSATIQPRYRLDRISAGAFDGYLTRYAREIKRYGGPVMLRPFHEMDGNWYPWGGTANGNHPRDFVPAWRHVHDLFARLGVHNVTWVWSLNATSVPLRADNTPREYWPGAGYVDWIGLSGFNFGRSRSFGSWVSFNTLFRARIAQLHRYHKPIAITEISSAEVGGDKAAWIRQTFAELRGYRHIGALIWYDHKDAGTQDWRIRSSPAAQAAFRRAIRARNILSAPQASRAATAKR
jgi:beta-mannanase